MAAEATASVPESVPVEPVPTEPDPVAAEAAALGSEMEECNMTARTPMLTAFGAKSGARCGRCNIEVCMNRHGDEGMKQW